MPGPPPYGIVKMGDTGPDVIAWQKVLGVVPVDGTFGKQTHDATVCWQKRLGHPPTGIVTIHIWNCALNGQHPVIPQGCY